MNYYRIIGRYCVVVILLVLFQAHHEGFCRDLVFKNDTSRGPNVIIVMTDDQGYADLGFHGNKVVKTPNIDRFFRESVRATNFHVSPTCAPTRAALMTGRYTNRVGAWHTIAGRSLVYEDEKFLSEVFAEGGYRTGIFGKWHLGDNYPFRPEDRGFQESLRHGGGGVTQGPDYWGNDYFDDTYWFNSEPKQYRGYVTDVLFDEGIRFIENNKNRPFFLYLPTNAPHSPYHVPERYYRLYEGRDDLLEEQKRFYAMITNIDDNFGRLLNRLKQLDIADNTIVIFMTDNGSAAGFKVEGGEVYGYNAGLRGMKNSPYEGGHRVPFAVRWPKGNIGIDRDVDQLLGHIDLFPTLVELAKLPFVEVKALDGLSFADLLQGNVTNWPKDRSLIVDSQRLLNLVKWRQSAVMSGNWRLVDGVELYDISSDPAQTNDIADAYPEVKSRLRESYEKWWSVLVQEEVNDRYAYIKIGTRYENPVRISAHDMLIYPFRTAWHQYGALVPVPGQGAAKIEIVNSGRYRISLRRYPRESKLAINQPVAARESSIEINYPMPASSPIVITSATLFLGQVSETKVLEGGEEEIDFEATIPEGKYDLIATLSDQQGRVYPSFYTYIERIGN